MAASSNHALRVAAMVDGCPFSPGGANHGRQATAADPLPSTHHFTTLRYATSPWRVREGRRARKPR